MKNETTPTKNATPTKKFSQFSMKQIYPTTLFPINYFLVKYTGKTFHFCHRNPMTATFLISMLTSVDLMSSFFPGGSLIFSEKGFCLKYAHRYMSWFLYECFFCFCSAAPSSLFFLQFFFPCTGCSTIQKKSIFKHKRGYY